MLVVRLERVATRERVQESMESVHSRSLGLDGLSIISRSELCVCPKVVGVRHDFGC